MLLFWFLFVFGGDVETQMLLYGAMGLTGGGGAMGEHWQPGWKFSCVCEHWGRFTHLYETNFRVSYTFFGVLRSLWANGFGHV